MAIQQVVPISILLLGDGTSTEFTFALGDLYQISSGSAVPYGNLGAVPSGIAPSNSNPPGAINLVESTTIDATGNITLTLTNPLEAGTIVNYVLNLLFTSGDVSSFPASTPVNIVNVIPASGTLPVTVSNFPSSQTISGAVEIEGHAGAILDGTAGSPSTGVLTIQGVSGGTTVPVSGTVVATQTSGSNLHVDVDNFPATQPVSGTVAVSNLPSTQAVSNGGTFAVQASITTLGQQLAAASVPVVLTSAQIATLSQFSTVSVSNFPATQPVSNAGTFPVQVTDFPATVAVTQSTSPWTVNGTVTANQGGAPWSVSQSGLFTVQQGSAPWSVIFSSPQHVVNDASSAIIGTVGIDQTTPGTTNGVQVNAPLPAGTNLLGSVKITNGTSVVGVIDGAILSLKTDMSSVAGTATATAAAGIQMVGISDSAGIALNSVVKGAQAANALGTQDLKDSGRTYVTLVLNGVSGVTSEALATMTINFGGVTTSNTQYTVSAGKTFRIQSISFEVQATVASAGSVVINLRAGSTVSTSSGILCHMSAASAAKGASGLANQSFPDGLEIASGQQVGISQIATVTTTTIDVTVVGFEY